MWDKIEKKMKEKKITQYRLAKETGITQQALSHLRKGNTKNPSFETVKKIADALGMSLDEFR